MSSGRAHGRSLASRLTPIDSVGRSPVCRYSRERERERELNSSSSGSRNTSNTTNNKIKSPKTAINVRL
jgi:hypothetical protein